MSNCQDSGIVQNCLPHDSAHIYRRLRDTPMTHRHMLDKSKVLVHQKQMAFLHLQILHMRIKEIIDSQATAQIGTLCHILQAVTLTKLYGCLKSYRLGIPDTLNHLQVLYPSLGNISQALLHHIEYLTCLFHILLCTCTDNQRNQLHYGQVSKPIVISLILRKFLHAKPRKILSHISNCFKLNLKYSGFPETTSLFQITGVLRINPSFF